MMVANHSDEAAGHRWSIARTVRGLRGRRPRRSELPSRVFYSESGTLRCATGSLITCLFSEREASRFEPGFATAPLSAYQTRLAGQLLHRKRTTRREGTRLRSFAPVSRELTARRFLLSSKEAAQSTAA